ncbi:MAG TPA: glycosyltransferase family 2 protein [Casimicrobiaceae bacterium]
MKFWGVAMVRDEADIIEAFVRHNLTVLDGLAIFDHGSSDGTGEILAALAAEGLPVSTVVDANTDFRQSAVISRLARQVFATHDPDFIFPLDADEFLKVPSRAQLEARLATLPRRVHAICTWQNYVPDFALEADTLALLRSARRAPTARPPVTKAVVSRYFLHGPMLIAEGNHMVLHAVGAEPHSEARHRPLSPDACAIAHVPIRSAMQFSAKIAVGWLACLVQPDRPERLCYHWGEVFALLRSGRPLTPALLTAIAANYGKADPGNIGSAAVELTDDPFLADFRNRHDGVGRTDSLALVLRFAERLARQIGGKVAPGQVPPD